MDSLTQFALGAAVSTVCLGKTLGPRKAALLGGVLGTVPDLDVFLPFDNPVDAFVLHRGWTHSFFVHAIATPVIGELIVRSVKALRDHRWMVWLTVFLCFTTHALIDAITVYGTRIFWPFYPDPVGVGSVFIIDPLYTLPIVGVVVWAFASRYWTLRFRNALVAALMFTTAYLGLSMVLQAHVENRAKAIFADAGIEVSRVFAIAGPLNTVVWKVIGMEDDRYHNVYLSLLDDGSEPRIYTHQRHPELVAGLGDNDAFQKLEWFSRGYYRAELEGQQIVVSDLRMGLTPNYVFRFAVAEQRRDAISAIEPVPLSDSVGDIGQDLDWLADRFLGHSVVREAEFDALSGCDERTAMC
ncbi:MAG: metal-dependent hydrolase [Candidatus Phaeomarinobacter sp.]